MAYSNHGGFDFRSEMRIIRDFARGLDVIAEKFIERAKEVGIDRDDDCAAALAAQAALVADRLDNVMAQLDRVPVEAIERFDRLLCGLPESLEPRSDVVALRPKTPKP